MKVFGNCEFISCLQLMQCQLHHVPHIKLSGGHTYFRNFATTPTPFSDVCTYATKMPGKKKQLDICVECKRASKPAIHAAKLGHTKCLTTAYRELGVFNERDNFGATPIHFAARFGQLECLKWLVARSGVSPNAVTRTGATAAHDAAATGHLNCLEYLLKNTKCDVRDTTSEGATVLHLACSFGRIEVVKWLMDYLGSSPSEKGANNVTPVHLCSAKNHLNCLKWLTQHPQYIPNEETEHGATAVYFAAQEGSLDCLKWLVQHAEGDPYIAAEDGMSAIHAAAQAGQLPCLRWLVEEAAVPVRSRSADGATPAHFAAASGEVECLEWILSHGGSVLDRDDLGGTLVHDAAEQGQVKTLVHLMKRGVDVTSKDNDGLTPLDIAKENRNEECIRLLFKAQKPEILVSLTPKQSMSRASAHAEDEERAAQMRQKQREFEQMMLSGVSNEQREAMWQTAQEKATAIQPGLKLLLEGTAEVSPSAFSLDGATRITPAGSLRRRQKPSNKDQFVPKDMSPFKPRPGISVGLFQPPIDSKPTQDVSVAKEPPKAAEATQSLQPNVELRNKPKEEKSKSSMSPSRKAEFRQSGSGDSPIPKRAKFIKKFSAPKAASKDKKKLIKTSSSKLTAEGGKAKKSEKKSKKSVSSLPDSVKRTVPPTKPRKESVTDESRKRKVSKTKVKQVPEPKQEKSKNEVGDSEPKKEQEPTASYEPEGQTPSTSYEMVAETLAEKLVKETVSTQTALNEKGSSVTKEDAIIIKENEKKWSLLTPDKAVTVTFKGTSDGEQPSLITPIKTIEDNELSSPEGSDDESGHRQRDSFITPGFERLDHQNFDHFGRNIQDLESHKAQEDKQWQAGRVTSMRNSGGLAITLGEKVKKGDGLAKKLNFEDKAPPHVVKNGAEGGEKDTALSRWEKRHSLNRIDQLPPGEQQLVSAEQILEANSENEEEDILEETVSQISVESMHLKHLDSKAIYRKVQDFERQWEERGYTEVFKMRDRLQEPHDDQAGSSKGKKLRPASGVQEGIVSEKLMVFGGSTDYVKSPWKQAQPQERVTKTKPHLSSPAKTSPIKEKLSPGSSPSSPEKDATTAVLREAVKDVVDGPTERSPSNVSPSHGKVKRRSSLSSRASVTTFETIREAEEDREEAGHTTADLLDHVATELAGDESTDKIVPLPKLHPNLSRRLSEERLRLDGLLSADQSGDSSSKKEPALREGHSKSGSRSTKARSVLDSGEARQQLHVSFQYIDQRESSPGSAALREKMGKSRSRPVSAPPFHLKDSKTPALAANMIGRPSGEIEAKEILKAESRVVALLSPPQCTSSSFPPQLTRGSLQIWKQEAGYICSIGSATFNAKDVYIFHYVAWQGPLLHHVYQWVGNNASKSLVHSAYEHCQMLAKCLPGRPVMHREFQGYESFSFVSALGSEAKKLKKYKAAVPYLNSFLTKALLYTFDESLSSFETVEDSNMLAEHLRTLCVPVILDTSLCVFVWLPRKCWEDKKLKNAFSIAELFIAQCSYPKWTPVTVVIQEGEVWEFYSHFSSWPFVDLRLVERSSALCLPPQNEPDFPAPANSQTKIWLWENQKLKQLAPDEVDMFDSSHIYLVEYTEHKQSSLYAGFEGMIYIWVGAEVAERKDALLSAVNKARTLGASSKIPVMIVPENLEPPQLLNLLGIERTRPSINKHPTHTLPLIFACEVNKGVVTFTQLQQPVTKKNMQSDKCYLLSYKDMLFVWQGKRWKARMIPFDVATNFISQFHSWKNENDFVISLFSEGNEGEAFWKWFDMKVVPVQVEEIAAVPKRPSKEEDVRELLVKAREIITNEMETEEKDEVFVREPPSSRPLLLTRSQEATFESVEKLQAQLEDLVENGGRDETSEKDREGEEAADNSENKQKSPVRLSQAMQELSDITSGLSELLQSSAQARAEEQEREREIAASKTEGATSEMVPADRNLLSSSQATLEESNPDTQVKSKKLEPSLETLTLSVTVEIVEGPSKGVYEVTVKEKSPVIVLIFKVARASGFVLKSTSAIFEVCEALKIQCPLEDHELIKDVVGRWPSKNPPKLVLRDFASKNILWSVNPPIPKESIRAFAKEGKVPEISSDLLYSTKQGRSRKMKWKQGKHCLKGVGVYSIGESKKGSKLELSASLDHRLYTPIIASIKDSEIPNKYCFIMKPPLSWKEKDLKFYCASDFMSMARWVHGIRLIKYGIQLRGNYTAMRTRLKKTETKTEETAVQQST